MWRILSKFFLFEFVCCVYILLLLLLFAANYSHFAIFTFICVNFFLLALSFVCCYTYFKTFAFCLIVCPCKKFPKCQSYFGFLCCVVLCCAHASHTHSTLTHTAGRDFNLQLLRLCLIEKSSRKSH